MLKKGFTLIELLIVIGIVAILSAVIIVAITPGERLAEARDITRERHLLALESALYIYQIDDPALSFPAGITSTLTEICNTDKVDSESCEGLVDISDVNITIPVDPGGVGEDHKTGYIVAVVDDKVALKAEGETKFVGIGVGEEEEIPEYESCGDYLVDPRDNEVYRTVQIGGQCWMADNMRATTYPDGSPIDQAAEESGDPSWDTGTNYSCPPDGEGGWDCDAAETLGMFYQWAAAMNGSTSSGAQGVCPDGWYIPTDSEWHTLRSYLWDGETDTCALTTFWECYPAAAKMANNVTHADWEEHNLTAHSDFGLSGFDAPPAGRRSSTGGGNYGFYPRAAFFWSSTNETQYGPWVHYIDYDSPKSKRLDLSEKFGFSVRCIEQQ